MSQIKAAIFDIDDTLFDMRTKKFIQSAIMGIKELQKRGILVILATGRPPLTAKAIYEEGVYPDYITCSNGHLILNKKGEIIKQYIFGQELVEDVYQYCQERGIGLLWKFPDYVYEYIHADIFENFYNKTKDSRKYVVFNEKDIHLKCNPNSGCLGCDDTALAAFNEAFKGQCTGVRIDDHSSDLLMYGVNKKISVSYILKENGINPEQCIGFGDNMNDIEVLDYVGRSICVGNGSEELKTHVDYVTDTITEDGVYNALVREGLI